MEEPSVCPAYPLSVSSALTEGLSFPISVAVRQQQWLVLAKGLEAEGKRVTSGPEVYLAVQDLQRLPGITSSIWQCVMRRGYWATAPQVTQTDGGLQVSKACTPVVSCDDWWGWFVSQHTQAYPEFPVKSSLLNEWMVVWAVKICVHFSHCHQAAAGAWGGRDFITLRWPPVWCGRNMAGWGWIGVDEWAGCVVGEKLSLTYNLPRACPQPVYILNLWWKVIMNSVLLAGDGHFSQVFGSYGCEKIVFLCWIHRGVFLFVFFLFSHSLSLSHTHIQLLSISGNL